MTWRKHVALLSFENEQKKSCNKSKLCIELTHASISLFLLARKTMYPFIHFLYLRDPEFRVPGVPG